MKQLTEKQKRFFVEMVKMTMAHNKPPSYREMMGVLSIKNINTVVGYLRALEKKGYVSKQAGSYQVIGIHYNIERQHILDLIG